MENDETKNSCFLTYNVNDQLKYIIYGWQSENVFIDEITGIAPCFLKIYRGSKAFRLTKTSFTLDPSKVSPSTEEEIRELYKYLKYDKEGD